MKYLINLVFLILVLFVQNLYCAQEAQLIKVDSLKKQGSDKLFELIHNKDFDYDLDRHLMKELNNVPEFKESKIKEYIAKYATEFINAIQINFDTDGAYLFSSIKNYSAISTDNKFAVLFSGGTGKKLVVLKTGLVIDFVNSEYKYSKIDQGLEIIHLVTNLKSYVYFDKNVSNIVNPNNRFTVSAKYNEALIEDTKTGNNFLIYHKYAITHLRISNDSKYIISACKNMWKITCIDKEMLNSLNLMSLKLISWLYKQFESNKNNNEYIIVLDEYQNQIFNSLPRFMQKALLSNYKIEHTLLAVF